MKPKIRGKLIPNLFEEVTLKIIDLLKDQQLTWDRSWIMLDGDGCPAYNAVSGRRHSGLNQILLSINQCNKGYPYSSWLTFSQINIAGGVVRTGERATRIVYLKPMYFDLNGKMYSEEKVRAMRQSKIDEKVEFTKRFLLRYYNVFNIEQTAALPKEMYIQKEPTTIVEFEKDKRAEDLINRTGAVVSYKRRNIAYYDCLTDVIHLPERTQFKGKKSFYETALHELGHWTGHKKRLNRQILNHFGSTEYAKEELVAELCSTYLCVGLGFSKVITNNAAYIQDWIKVLNDDHKFIFLATHQAGLAAFFINSL